MEIRNERISSGSYVLVSMKLEIGDWKIQLISIYVLEIITYIHIYLLQHID